MSRFPKIHFNPAQAKANFTNLGAFLFLLLTANLIDLFRDFSLLGEKNLYDLTAIMIQLGVTVFFLIVLAVQVIAYIQDRKVFEKKPATGSLPLASLNLRLAIGGGCGYKGINITTHHRSFPFNHGKDRLWLA